MDEEPLQETGVLYIAIGEQSLKECRSSIASVRAHLPHTSVTVISSQEDYSAVRSMNIDRYLLVDVKGPWDWATKVNCIRKSPYSKTLYLDTDTLLLDDVSDVFLLLDRVDVAVCHEPVRTWGYELPGIPDSFPMLNTGVLAFKHSERMEQFFDTWHTDHNTLKNIKADKPNISFTDQNSFRHALFFSREIQIAVLPPEYNCRVSAGYVMGRVRILHAHADLQRIAQMMNASSGPRLHASIRGRFLLLLDRRRITISNPFKRIF